jgi:hypothetical protein
MVSPQPVHLNIQQEILSIRRQDMDYSLRILGGIAPALQLTAPSACAWRKHLVPCYHP